MMPQLFWGIDGRTHRLGPDGQALCHTRIDNSREPVERWVSGCAICDIRLRDRDVLQGFRQRAADAGHDLSPRGRPAAGGSMFLPVAFAVLAALVLWMLLR